MSKRFLMGALFLLLPACGGDDTEGKDPTPPAAVKAGKSDAVEHVSEEGGPCGFIDHVAYSCASALVCWPIGEEPGLGVCGRTDF